MVEFTLRDHPYPVGALAWSLDDSILLTSADNLIILWETKVGSLHILGLSHSAGVV